MSAPDLPELLSVAQVARYLGMGTATVHDQIRRGEFPVPVRKIGGRIKVAKVQLDRWLSTGDAMPREEAS